jgi:hypothetical protein
MNNLQLNKEFSGLKTIFFILLLYAIPAFSQPGWDKTIKNNLITYTPKDLIQGEIFLHLVHPPQPTNGISTKNLLLYYGSQIEEGMTGKSGEWTVKKSKIGDFAASKVLDYKGKTLMLGINIVNLPDDNHYVIQTVSDNDSAIMNKYSSRLSELIEEIGDPRHALKEPDTTKRVTDKSVHSSKPLAAKVGSPNGLKEIRGTMEFGIQPAGTFGLTGKVVALFDDDSFTRELGVVFSKGTERAKKENPEIWGKWRFNGEKLELKDFEEDEFQKTNGSWVATPGKKDMKLKGCFGNITSSSGGIQSDITKGQASSWCFNPDGRFAYGVTGYGTGIFDINKNTKGKSTAGYYSINQYAAHFVFDDGTEITTAFCFLDDDNEHIAINGKRLMLNY